MQTQFKPYYIMQLFLKKIEADVLIYVYMKLVSGSQSLWNSEGQKRILVIIIHKQQQYKLEKVIPLAYNLKFQNKIIRVPPSQRAAITFPYESGQNCVIQHGTHQPHITTEHVKSEWAALRGTINVTYTLDYKDLVKKKSKVSQLCLH